MKAAGLSRAYQEVVKQRGELREQLKTERERARRERGMRQRLERTMREHGMCLCPAQDDTCVTKQALAASEALDKLEVEDA